LLLCPFAQLDHFLVHRSFSFRVAVCGGGGRWGVGLDGG